MPQLVVMSALAIWLCGLELPSMAATERSFRDLETRTRFREEPPRLAFRTVASPWEPGASPSCANPTFGLCPQALWIAAGFLAQSIMILWLLHQRRRLVRSENRTREMIARLAHGNQMAAAGELSASISHELTQPITGMLSSANAALRWMNAPRPDLEKARAALVQVTTAGERASATICDVRSKFRSSPPEQKRVVVNDVVLSVLELVERELDARACMVEASLDKSRSVVVGDEVQLQQVILNLVMNAMDAMSTTMRARLLRVTTTEIDGEVMVSVSDAGVELPNDRLVKLFDPLFTAEQGGVGMALPICRRIVEAHNGRIWVKQGAPYGTIVQFALPLAAPRDRDVSSRATAESVCRR
jgi:C4-dicarboxylate-specific signal transduction histidine kinase